MAGEQVERQTVVRPSLDPSDVQAGARAMAQAVVGAVDQIEQATQRSTRALAGNSNAFEAMKRQLVDGYAEAIRYARGVQDLTLYGRAHQDQLGLIGQMLQRLSVNYGLVGEQALIAAQKAQAMRGILLDTAGRPIDQTGPQRQQAQSELVQIFQQRGQPAQPQQQPALAPYTEPSVSPRAQEVLNALATGRTDIFGLATLGYDRTLGGAGSRGAFGELYQQGLIQTVRDERGRFAGRQLTGATAYDLAGVSPPPGTPGTDLSGRALRSRLLEPGPLNFGDIFNLSRGGVGGETELQRTIRNAVTGGGGFGGPPRAPGGGGAGGPDDGRKRFPGLAGVVDQDVEAANRLMRQWGLINQAVESYKRTLADVAKLEAGGFLTSDQGSDIKSRAWDKARESIGLATDALKIYQRQVETLNQAEAAGLVTYQERTNLEARSRLNLGVNLPGAQSVIDQRRAQQQQADIQGAVNRFASVQAAPTGDQHAARAQDLEAAFGTKGLTSEMDRLRASIDPVFAASKEYEAELARIADASQKAGLSQAQMGAAIEQATARFARANQPLEGIENEIRANERLRASYDPIVRIEEQHARSLADIDRLERAGPAGGGVSSQRANELRRGVDASYTRDIKEANEAQKRLNDEVDRGRNITSYAVREIIVLGHEIVVGNYSRIPGSLIVLTEHFGGLSRIAERMIGFFKSLPGVATIGFLAALGVMTTMIVRSEELQRRILSLQSQIGAASGPDTERRRTLDVEGAARTLAGTTPLGRSEAFDALSEIAKSPFFDGTKSQLVELGQVAYEVSLRMGGDMQKAGQLMAQAFTDPLKAAQEASRTFDHTFTEGVINRIADLQAQGRRVDAITLFFDTLKQGAAGAKENMTLLQQEWNRFLELVTGEHGKAAEDAIGARFANGLARVIGLLDDLIEKFRDLREATRDIRPNTTLSPGFAFSPDISGTLPGGQEAPTTLATGNQVTVGQDVSPWLHRQLSAPGAQETVVSPAGALGIMQLIPTTAQQYGVNPTIPDQNVEGGMKFIADLWRRTGGDANAVAHGYNPGSAIYPSQVAAANPSTLPTDTVTMIETWGQVLGLPREAIDLGKRIAVVEHRGVQGGLTRSDIIVRPGVSDLNDQAAIQESQRRAALDTPGGAGNPYGADPRRQQRQALEDANKLALNEIANERLKNEQEQQLVSGQLAAQRTALQSAQAGGDQTAIDREQAKLTSLEEHLRTLAKAHYDLIEAQQRMAREAELSLRPLESQIGFARKLADIEFQFQQEAKGTPVDQSALQRTLNAEQEKGNDTVRDKIAQMELETRSQEALVAATIKGGDALVEETAHQKALVEAIQTADPRTEAYTKQVDALTEAYIRQAKAAQELHAAELVRGQRQQEQELQTQVQFFDDPGELARQQAIQRTREQLNLQPGQEPRTDTEQRAISGAAGLADLQNEIQAVEADYRELQSAGQSVFGTLEHAIVEPFHQGETAADRFRNTINTLVADITKEFLKLAVFNPLENALFGGPHRPDITDVVTAPERRRDIVNRLGQDQQRQKALDEQGGVAKDLPAVAKGLPIDAATGAVRVTVVNGPPGTPAGGAAGGAAHAVASAAAPGAQQQGGTPDFSDPSKFPVPPIPPDQRDQQPFVVGDSIGRGIQSAGAFQGDTLPNRSPQAVLDAIKALKPDQVQGRDVILSSGISNNTQQLEQVTQQIKELQDRGASSVRLMGVGDRSDFVGLNDKLGQIADATGARFGGALDPSALAGDRVHPTGQGYQAIVRALQDQQSQLQPSAPVQADFAADTAPDRLPDVQPAASDLGLTDLGPGTQSGPDSMGGLLRNLHLFATSTDDNSAPAAGATDTTARAVQQALLPTSPNGLPIDGGTNALRVVSADTQPSSPDQISGLISDGAKTAQNVESGNLGGTIGSGLNLLSSVSKLFGGKSGSDSGDSSGGPGSSGGGSIFDSLKQILTGNFDSIMGKGFYQNGGLIGSLFGSSGGADAGATDRALSNMGQGVYGPETAQQYAQNQGGGSSDLLSSLFSGIGKLFGGGSGGGGGGGGILGSLFGGGGGGGGFVDDGAFDVAAANGALFQNSHLAPISNFANSIVHAPTMFRFGSGQTGLMGEAGSEAIIPLRSGGIPTTLGHVLPLARSAGGNLAIDHSSLLRFADGGMVEDVAEYLRGGIVPFAEGGVPGVRQMPVPFATGGVIESAAPAKETHNTNSVTHHWNITTPDAQSFMKSRTQIEQAAFNSASRSTQRNST